MRKVLGPKFFRRSAFVVAPELLGKFLVRKNGEKILSEMITEVEVYDGFEDLASHACRARAGRRRASQGKTPRNQVMFEAGGVWYVYLVYGMYHLLNIVTGPEDYPSAILIRKTENAKGPGVLTKRFEIDKLFYGLLSSKETGLWIEDRGVKIPEEKIKTGPRIGVDYAGPIWSKKEYRYYLQRANKQDSR